MDEKKEEFCGACVAGLVALAGVGTSGMSSKKNKKNKKIIFWVGISISVISIAFLIYFLCFKKCNECA